MNWAIETNGFTKYFFKPRGLTKFAARNRPEILAVDQVNLYVRYGELFGLVGPNGAGKTTLIKMLCTLIMPTSGSACVNGYPLEEDTNIKATIGLVTSDERSFYWRLSGRQNLNFFATLHNLLPDLIHSRVDEVLAIVDLMKVADNSFQTYSTGMRQRLSIARALLNEPSLLFLDEPTRGLDPPSIQAMHKLVREELIDHQRITVFLTSHWLEEVEQLCDRIAIMNEGQIIACGTLTELRENLGLGEKYTLIVRDTDPNYLQVMAEKNSGILLHQTGENETSIELRTEERSAELDMILNQIKQSQGQIIHISHEKISLEEIFSHHIKGGNKSIDLEVLLNSDHSPTFETQTKNNIGEPSSEKVLETPRKNSVKRTKNPFRIPWAFLKRDFQLETSYRFSFFLQFFNVFFSIALFYFLASFLGEAASPYLEPYGGDYFAFVLIGIAFAGYFGVGLSSFANSLRQAQTTGTMEAMLTTPTGLSTIIISSSLWSYFMTTFRVAMYLFIGAAFLNVNLNNGNYPLAFLLLILTIISFSSLGIIAASFIMVLKRGNPITWIFSTSSNLLGGIYYPVSVLPNWLLILSYLLPITYALRGMRLALLQGASFESIFTDILALVIFCVVLLPVSLIAFRYAVKKAKMDGSLTHY